MANDPVKISQTVSCGQGLPLVVIAGPCVIDDRDLMLEIGQHVKTVCENLKLPYVFKASFDKANRTSLKSYRGVGLEKGLEILAWVKESLEVPVTTDVHLPEQVAAVAEVVDLIQIPAFLARQTDLLVAAAQSGRTVNVKKGQFMAPWDMQHVVGKLTASGAENILLTERGTFFGYGRLVNDMRSLVQMREIGPPVVFDATHSVQLPSASDGTTGGQSAMVAPLARAAVAVGCDAVFIETHPAPERSRSDGPNMVRLDEIGELLATLKQIDDVTGLG